ncbi:glycosyltransferase family 2 protein [Qipengyuania mesophila]|uniref:glycosyltransferase family 2 protein n=1 Tax=Qipengyuania mesophila TaxID=2867246 RepID=UPI003511BCAA
MPRVDIALATYNGEKYLRPFLDSIIAQTYPSLRLVYSDDGSTDETLAVIDAYSSKLEVKDATLNPGGDILRNFENAIGATSASYVALADQDDVWRPEKISLLLEHMLELEDNCGSNTPIVVFSDLEIVDENLNTISQSFFSINNRSCPAYRFKDYVLGSHVPGCAFMINRALIDRALPFPKVRIHDHWLMLIATLIGRVGYVGSPLIKYRQHSDNVIGLKDPKFGKLAFPLKLLFSIGQRRRFWRTHARWNREYLEQLHKRFRHQINQREDLELIEAFLCGDRKTGNCLMRDAKTTRRKVDRQAIIRLMYGLAKQI